MTITVRVTKLTVQKHFFVTKVYNPTITIMHQNIAGALSKTDMLELTLVDLRKTTTPDIICLSETFFKSGHETNFKLSNYELVSFFSRTKKRGGVCILVRKGLEYKNKTNLLKHAVVSVFECCAIEIPNNNITIICLYRTPTSDVKDFLHKLDVLLHELTKNTKKRTVILGDININTLKKESKTSNHLQDICKRYNMTIHINEPTRGSSCLDHILSNIDNASALVLQLGLSDHETAQIITFPIDNKKEIPKVTYRYKRDYSMENIIKFKSCLNKLSFNEVFMESRLNEAFDIFHSTLLLFYNLCFPKIKVKTLNNQNKKKWVTTGLKNSCKTKRKLRIGYYKTKSSKHKYNYLQYSKILKKCISQSQKNTNNKFINNSKNKSKAAWQIIKNIDNSYVDDIDHIIYNNEKIYDPVRIAEIFNNYFTDLSQKSTQNIDANNRPNISTLGHSMFLLPMTENEVRTQVISLNNTNSAGNDEICTNILKQCIDELTSVLTYLINLSFEKGTFPQRLKLSIVRPILKKGCKYDIGNYRPITLIPIISKIFEKCMLTRLIQYCTKYHIINPDQYGFQKKKSTTLAMFAMIREVLTNVDMKKLTTVLFLDMSKAFDMVDHDTLLRKLEGIGVRGNPLQWIESYIRDRHQAVVISKTMKENHYTRQEYQSRYIHNSFGVPQGSVLGPFLFIIYINDIIKLTRHKTILFADDISIVVTSTLKEGLTQHETEINNTLFDIIKWLEINNLKINLSKTCFVQFNKLIKYNFNISYDGVDIEQTDIVKFLGIYIDEGISWKSQIEKVCDRINRFAYVLKRLRNATDRKTILTAYHAYVASVLRYGLLLWGNGVNINKVFVTQKKCIRAIYGVPPYQTCKPLFKELNILTVPNLYIFEVCKFVRYNPGLFHRAVDIYCRNTRNPERLVLNFAPRTAMYKKNCLNMCIKIYNKIPKHIKVLRPRPFLTTLYAWLIDKNYYSLKEFLG